MDHICVWLNAEGVAPGGHSHVTDFPNAATALPGSLLTCDIAATS